jgi:hypothetical protein
VFGFRAHEFVHWAGRLSTRRWQAEAIVANGGKSTDLFVEGGMRSLRVPVNAEVATRGDPGRPGAVHIGGRRSVVFGFDSFRAGSHTTTRVQTAQAAQTAQNPQTVQTVLQAGD